MIARSMILQAAARVFAELGVRAPSVTDLLKEAGISRRTFYRHFESKEDVMAALYRMGTDALLDACRLAVSEETDPLRQLERCIDAHLWNARQLGRLVFVLGGEAQRLESALHARRMEVHEILVSLLVSSPINRRIDPLLFSALVVALEGVTRLMLEDGDEGRDVTDAAVARVKRVMMRVATAALAGKGPGLAPLPTVS
jgi:AcrR family transcriptional regulator